MKYVKLFVRAFLAGISIALGGSVFVALSQTNKVAGAVLFAVGLFTICTFGYALFTGMAGYLLDGKIGKNVLELVVAWFGNFFGAVLVGVSLHCVLDDSSAFFVAAQTVAAAKVALTPMRAIVTGMLCGVLVYIAVDNYRNNTEMVSRLLGIMFCVPAFILSGFEHSVADMLYLAAGLGFGVFRADALAVIFYVTFGNILGSVLFANLRKFGNSPSK